MNVTLRFADGKLVVTPLITPPPRKGDLVVLPTGETYVTHDVTWMLTGEVVVDVIRRVMPQETETPV